ncbi:MAG: putative acyltransferase [Ilumatobacteraceae bacterium]|nr:putative acyltransferase [Ilumatobacteraceae bacterium]
MSKVDAYLAKQTLISKANYQFWKAMTTGNTRLLTRMHVEGRENVPKTGGFVLAPVHRSYIDTPISAVVTRRRLRYMAKDSMWKSPIWGWLISSVGGFPVSRGTTDIEALKRCFLLLAQGEPIVMFPEGERKSGPIVQPLFEGAAYVAAHGRVPIIPVGIGGSEAVMPKGAKFIHPHKVRVIVGKPIHPIIPETGRVPRSEVKRLTAELHDELQRLFDRAQAGLATPGNAAARIQTQSDELAAANVDNAGPDKPA